MGGRDEFSGLSGMREVYFELGVGYVSSVFPIFSNFSLFFNFLLYVWVLYVECMCVLGKLIFNMLISLFSCDVDVSLSLTNYLVSCENQFTSIQQHCALRGNFLLLVFTFDLYAFRYPL